MTRTTYGKAAAAAALATALLAAGCSNAGGSGGDGDLSVGYVVNFGSHEWYQNVVQGAEDAATEHGVQFQWEDANVDLSKQITQAENMLTQGVDVLMMSPVDPGGLSSVMAQADERGVPVVTESNAVDGAVTTVGIENYEAAKMLGLWAGEYLAENVDGTAHVLIVGLPTQKDTQDRAAGFVDGLTESGADFEITQEVNGGGLKDIALDVSTDAFTAHPEINVIFGINDDSALGATQAYTEAGLDPAKLSTFGFGVEGQAGKGALTSDGPYLAGLAMFPEYVGATLIEQAIAAAEGEEIPERTVTPAAVVTADNLGDYYTNEGGTWVIDYDAVAALAEQ